MVSIGVVSSFVDSDTVISSDEVGGELTGVVSREKGFVEVVLAGVVSVGVVSVGVVSAGVVSVGVVSVGVDFVGVVSIAVDSAGGV